ncbi:L-asparaginase 1 [Desulfonema ishimotonii]|uniref:asparaginase n=1 Tax=Desulfonema ishimotonii TaxID=45657 RepID=A0A401G3M1_9BACT|nr:asparaginase [Desulfonema ishimotonii]GBC63830.1 L-asparaginase 1 [Desulfonema ishimotonii]
MGKKIYIAHTGGTIGMKRTPDGYMPSPGYLAEQMALMPELKRDLMPSFDIREYDPLIDSSNMSPENWLKIARDIAENYDRYDGFVVLHGTDTMAYTASALPFMLRGLDKPVILTGGQIPLCEIRNDSRENLITAMLIAANYNIPEVCLFFGNRLLRGNRSVKVDANSFEAFDSPNLPPLGVTGIGIDINWDLVLPRPKIRTDDISVHMMNESRVAALRLFPGISEEVVKNILAPPIRGLVLGTYGVGNGPGDNPKLMAALKTASDRGVVIVNCTQCLRGRVRMGAYAAGTALGRAGVISGFDMTTEAALAKMFYLFSQNLPADEIREKMQQSLRGELTPPQASVAH